MSLNKHLLRSSLLITALSCAAGCSSSSEPSLGVGFDDAESQILVTYSRDLSDGETLHARVRRGAVDELDCARDYAAINRIDEFRANLGKQPTWRGPRVDPSVFEGVYDTEWLEMPQPTAEMLEEAMLGDYVIDVCLVDAGEVIAGQSFDIRRALDKSGGDGKFDGDEEERIASTTAYAERCVADLGEIPFFEKLEDGDYATYNCLDSTAIPTTVTDEAGNITLPETQQSQCDNPQYIYSLCEPNAVDGRTNGPRVATRTNEDGTSWVLLCRKAKSDEGAYNDIAMIGHNPYTGKTCYFQNALYSRTDGLHVPHPGDKVESEQSPQQSASLWNGIHGGIGSGIECAKCHSTDPFIHTPWIDGALDESGDPVVPKMGQHDDFVLGYNDAPYSIINTRGQGWTMPQQLVSPEASACTRCHRIGADDRWMNSWDKRLVGEDSSWVNITTEAHRSFDNTFWMPPDVDGLDETTWAESDYGKALQFILDCGRNNGDGCIYADVPTSPIVDGGSLPEIELEGNDLAVAALAVLGADVDSADCPGGNCANRRCAECHSVSKSGLRRWSELTRDAWNTCNLKKDPAEMSQDEALAAVNCLRVDPDDSSSVFEAAKLGVLTTGVQYTDFRRLFQTAFGDDWLRPYAGFKARVGMPKGSHPKLSQKEYATLLKWFDDGLPALDDALNEPPPPQSCTESFDSAAIAAHVDNMQYDGWGAINDENGIRMHGCTPGADPQSCFASLSNRDDWSNGVGKVLELHKLAFRTSFWTRSSADGRYVGNGGGSEGATITDLSTGRDIAVDASYDPGFFPDNSGFIFQGATGGAGICAQSMLETDDLVDFSEEQCMNARGVNLYQHVARGVGGGDYFIINSQFTSDSGHASSDPRAHFNASSTMKFTPMIYNGATYEQLPETIVDSPYEGDSVLSPSSQLVVSRLSGPEGKSLGYVVRRVQATKFGDNYAINIDQKLATICVSGAKPNISFDERFMVTHHYHDGRADIIMVDLLTGQQYQVTNMPEGQYAQFPHFRSDGWFYFLVTGGGDEYVAASDAALEILNQ
jgi:hypothetical protein